MDDFFDFYSNNKTDKGPLVNVTESERDYQINVSLPGYDQGDVDVKIDKHLLYFSTNKAFEEKNKNAEETVLLPSSFVNKLLMQCTNYSLTNLSKQSSANILFLVSEKTSWQLR